MKHSLESTIGDSKFDPKKARDLLAKAGYPEGQGFPEVSAVYNTDQTNRLIAEFVQAQWKEHLNIDIKLESQECLRHEPAP